MDRIGDVMGFAHQIYMRRPTIRRGYSPFVIILNMLINNWGEGEKLGLSF